MRHLLTALALLAASPAAAQNNYWVRVVNNSGYDLINLYAQCRDCSWWSGDLLGMEVIPSGYNMSVWITDGTGYCWYSLRGIGSNGAVWNIYMNVCEQASWTLVN